jgi:uncharacterized protein (DUF2062 family)
MSRVLKMKTTLRAAWQRLRGGELSPRRAAASVGVGIFAGCFPLYGLQTLVCVGLTVPLKLDFPLAWFASNVANPFTAPFLIALEIELGSFLATGRGVHVSVASLEWSTLGALGGYALLGGAIVGVAGGGLSALVTYLWMRRPGRAAPLVVR